MSLNAQCTVCFENLGETLPPMATQCGHLYCLDCATFCFATPQPCASCRTPQTLVNLIKLFPNYTPPETSARTTRQYRPGTSEGDEIMESARQLLSETSMQADDAEAIVQSAEGYIHSVNEDSSSGLDVRPMLRSLGTVFSELRLEIQRLRTLKEAQVKRDQESIQRLNLELERERNTARDDKRRYREAYKQIKAKLEEDKRVLQNQLDKTRQNASLATAQLQSYEDELTRVRGEADQWKNHSMKYKKKYYALRQSQRSLKQSVSIELDDDLEVV